MLSTELAELKAYMAENPGAVIEDVARERKVTPRAVLEALPDAHRRWQRIWRCHERCRAMGRGDADRSHR